MRQHNIWCAWSEGIRIAVCVDVKYVLLYCTPHCVGWIFIVINNYVDTPSKMHQTEILARKDFYELTFSVSRPFIFYDLNSHCNPGRAI